MALACELCGVTPREALEMSDTERLLAANLQARLYDETGGML